MDVGFVTDFHRAYHEAVRQLNAKGRNSIGVRGTPYISFWPMKAKWRKFGDWFTAVGTDGDWETAEFWVYSLEDQEEQTYRRSIEPLMIQLFYQKLSENEVLQLAWVRPDWSWRTPRIVKSEKLPTMRVT